MVHWMDNEKGNRPSNGPEAQEYFIQLKMRMRWHKLDTYLGHQHRVPRRPWRYYRSDEINSGRVTR